MTCPSCRHANPPESNFCLVCGARLALACASCGTALPADSRFCNKCGSPVTVEVGVPARLASPDTYTPKHLAEKILTSKAALEGERKLVTVLFADLKGSMELLADRDPEEARKLLDPVLEHMMEAVTGFHPRRSGCCNVLPPSARTCRSACSRRSPTDRSRSCGAASSTSRPLSSCTRPESSLTWNTCSSTR